MSTSSNNTRNKWLPLSKSRQDHSAVGVKYNLDDNDLHCVRLQMLDCEVNDHGRYVSLKTLQEVIELLQEARNEMVLWNSKQAERWHK